ncbi:MAG: redoxin family protein [Myxococcota bacterium]
MAFALALAGCASVARTSPASEWSGLPLAHPDGRTTTAGGLLSSQRATVFVFWATQCPCVRRYQARVEALASAYSARGVAFVGIDSNADDTLEDIARVTRARGVTMPVWRDAGGQLARALGARSTPTVVLVDARGEVKFRGWLDNERLPGESDREPWLEEALVGVLDGTPYAAASPTWGCAITRSLKSVAQCHSPAVEVSSSPAAPEGATP